MKAGSELLDLAKSPVSLCFRRKKDNMADLEEVSEIEMEEDWTDTRWATPDDSAKVATDCSGQNYFQGKFFYSVS